MDILYEILGLLLFGEIIIIVILRTWQEINLNKEIHDKEIEKIETEIILIKEQISNNKKMHLKSLEQIENLIKK